MRSSDSSSSHSTRRSALVAPLFLVTILVAGGLIAMANASGDATEALPEDNLYGASTPQAATPAPRQTGALGDGPVAAGASAPAEPRVPDDPRLDSQWAVDAMGLDPVLTVASPARQVVVAVLDTGLDAAHEDAPRIVRGYDFIDDDATPQDVCGHGTHVAGTIAAATNNGAGIAGIANAAIMPIRVLGDPSDGCRGSLQAVADGITFAADNGADVIVLSLGCQQPCYDQGVKDALVHANEAGVLVIAAAGNNTGGPVNFPADQPEVMAVGATDMDGSWAQYSAAGPEVEILAPGTSILSTYPGNRYEWMSGTSMAAPHVAGAAALLMTTNPDMTAQEVRMTLTATATDLGLEPEYQGAGALNVGAAVATATQ